MKKLYTIVITLVLFVSSFTAFGQNDQQQVKQVLNAYKTGVESLKTTDLANLFMENSQVFESGGVEGTFNHYLDHHLGPELKAFKSFKFNDYSVDVIVDGDYAFATEAYTYRIELAKGERVIEKKGVATSVLKKVDGQWKIMKTHSSSRNK
ncbi:MAG: nuclear transport factor 2 family protein [Owenweeksia sp.]|jgi:ketosteroid isomerase-like protein|uniref:DUF4440 domain-containing protein n=1 Tax=Roseivirga seohaensis TaxID=1914963 RepID=A0A150XKL9_9BACT|nr:nuclear transport factor 2 family protein [Roseivirga seohaensis]KYG79287.1 DUF4440 domain-containing protein [Roseivirga seohaensis]|tara:strand:+ start:1292 stop:1744 length:453 start_codon:yes stop_codon:yes gene_type:complete